MIMTDAAVVADRAAPRERKGTPPELSLNEIAALLRGEIPASTAPSCLEQLPFIPMRMKASGN